MSVPIILGVLSGLFFWFSAAIEDVGKLKLKYSQLQNFQEWLRQGHRTSALKISLGLAATVLGLIALIVSDRLQKNAEAKAATAQAQAEAATRKRQHDELTSTACALAHEIEFNVKILKIKLGYTALFANSPSAEFRRYLARTVREGGVHSIEFESRTSQLTLLEDARKPIVDAYDMLWTLAQEDQAFLHDLEDPTVNLRDVVEKAKSQRVMYRATWMLAEKNLPVAQKLCSDVQQ
jgi:hypothetical protein